MQQSDARIGMEWGYHVTLVRDATSARSHEALHAAMDIDGPTYAHANLNTAGPIRVFFSLLCRLSW